MSVFWIRVRNVAQFVRFVQRVGALGLGIGLECKLTTFAEKTVNLRGFKSVYKPRNINVLFSQCGSQQHGSTSRQM